MYNFNADVMQLDDGATGAPRVARARNTAPKITEEELAAENKKFDPATGMPLELLESDIPEIRQSFTKPGFTPGPFPKEFEKFFGPADPNMLGYKIVTNSDGSQQLEVQTGPGSTSTFGAPIKVNADGTVSSFTKTGTPATNTANTVIAGLKTAEQIAADAAKAQAQGERQSAYDLLYSQFKQYGLESLVEPLKGLVISGASPSEFTIRLRETDSYKKRFSANAERINKGLKAISEAAIKNWL
jgi:hypothetical protein